MPLRFGRRQGMCVRERGSRGGRARRVRRVGCLLLVLMKVEL